MASPTYEKLKSMLKEKGDLSVDEIESVSNELGKMTGAEMMTLEALKLKISKKARAEVTMDEYLQATQVLDTAEEGSEEYQAAEEIVNAFESGG